MQSRDQVQQDKWDVRFLELARHVASWSKDPSTKVGAVLVRPDRSVSSLGFNGFPKRAKDEKHLLESRERKYARTVHAEMNALLQANESVVGFTMYCSHPPCIRCAAHLAQVGLRRVVWARPEGDDYESRWKASCDEAQGLLSECGVWTKEFTIV